MHILPICYWVGTPSIFSDPFTLVWIPGDMLPLETIK
jgi:hypothetical protein